MKHRIRPGVVLTEVCGEFLLLATMDAARYCPHVYQVNETAAFFWKLLERGCTEEEMIAAVIAEYGVPEALVRRDLQRFFRELQEKGYCLAEENA